MEDCSYKKPSSIEEESNRSLLHYLYLFLSLCYFRPHGWSSNNHNDMRRLMNNQTERQRNRQVIRKTDTLRKSPWTDNVVINLSACRWEGISCIHTVPKEYHATTFLWGFLFCNTISRFLFRGITSKKVIDIIVKFLKTLSCIFCIYENYWFSLLVMVENARKSQCAPSLGSNFSNREFYRDAKVNSVSDKIKKTK